MAETHTESAATPRSAPLSPDLQGRPAFKGLVASRLLDPRARADLQLLYDYLASLRAIADTPALEFETREFLFNETELVLLGHRPTVMTAFTQPVVALMARLAALAMDNDAPLKLLQSARRDVARSSCAGWTDLMLYCRYAAEPLGRFALELHKIKDAEVERRLDALVAALCVLRLMRQAGNDWHEHGRCYLPTDWFAEEGTTPEHLAEHKMNVGIRRVYDRMLQRVDGLLDLAAPLPGFLPEAHMKGEVVRLTAIGRAERDLLARSDALAKKLRVGALVRAQAFLKGWMARR